MRAGACPALVPPLPPTRIHPQVGTASADDSIAEDL